MVNAHISRLRATLCAACVIGVASFAAPVWAGAQSLSPSPLAQTRADLAEVSEALRNGRDLPAVSAAELRARIGLEPWIPAPKLDLLPKAASRITGPATPQVMNFRLALAILTQTYGGKDTLDILNAQPQGRTDALAFRGGVVTLDDIRRHSALVDPRDAQDDMTLRVPVILWEDTELRMSPGDALEFSRPDGAFLISFGRVTLHGAKITVTGGENATSPDFVPFVTIAGGGSLDMRDSHLRGLGFGGTDKFSGLSVVANPLMRRDGPVQIENSSFEDIVTLALAGTPGAMLRGNRFANTRSNALRLDAVAFGLVEGNLFHGTSDTNAIRVQNGSNDTHVVGNMILEGDRAGIVVQGRSDRVSLRDNIIWNRDGGGIKLTGTSCGNVSGNIVLDNRQKGIEVRRSDATRVTGNTVVGSRNAGIWVSAQSDGALTHLAGNKLSGNKSGLSMATGAQVTLSGNDFSTQMPRILDGDVALHSVALLNNLTGARPVLLTSSGALEGAKLPRINCPKGGL